MLTMLDLEEHDQPHPHQPIDLRLRKYINKILLYGRFILFIVVVVILGIILIHNFFAPDEKDISQETINKIIKLLPIQEAPWKNETAPSHQN